MNSRINMVCDSYVSLEDVMLQNYIAQNYSFPIVNGAIREDVIDEFLDVIKTKYPAAEVTVVKLNITSEFIYIELKEHFYVELVLEKTSKSYVLNIYGKSYPISLEFYELSKPYEPASLGLYMEIYNFYMDNNNIPQTRKDFKKFDEILEVSSLYYPYMDTDILFKKFVISSENILLLSGLPGVGKSKLVTLFQQFMFKHQTLFNYSNDDLNGDTYFKVAYIKNEEILSKDIFWEDLSKGNYNLVFLDDADHCLMSRDSEVSTNEDVNRKKFMSQLLSFTDGGVNDNNKTKIIITTNRSIDSIDTAALRRGRTFDILQLPMLSYEEGKVIWNSNELDLEDYDNLFKNKKDIIPAELGSEIDIRNKLRKMNDNVGDYLKRDGISLLHSYRNKKNIIGF